MSFRNLSIRAKLVAAFSILTLLAIGLGLLGVFGTQRMREQALNIETNWLPSMRGWARSIRSPHGPAPLFCATCRRPTRRSSPASRKTWSASAELDEKKADLRAHHQLPEERALYETFTREARNLRRRARVHSRALARR